MRLRLDFAKGDANAAVWLHGAFAIRRSRSLAEAHEFLLRGESAHQDDATFMYDLTCYETQLGEMESAEARLCRAYELNPALRRAALDAPSW